MSDSDEERALAAAGPHATWLSCLQPSGSTCPFCGPEILYTSTDSGTTWTRESTPHTKLYGRLTVEPIDPKVAWAIETFGSTTRVLRTVDGGQTWSTVHPDADGPVIYSTLVATDAATAWSPTHSQRSTA